MSRYLTEPGFWVVAGLVIIGIVRAIAAVAHAEKAKRMACLTENLLSDRDATNQDRVWVRHYLKEAQGNSMWLVASLAPFLTLLAPFFVVLEFLNWVKRGNDESIEVLTRRLNIAQKRSIEIVSGQDLAGAKLWDDKRRVELQELAESLEWSAYPLLSLWLVMWMAPALAIAVPLGIVLALLGYSSKRLMSLLLKDLQSLRGNLLLR